MRRLSALSTALLSLSAYSQGAKPAPSPAPAPATLQVGVVAAVNDEIAKKQAEALAAFVGSALKTPALPHVYPDQEALAKAVGKTEVDLAVLGPLGYVRLDPKAKTQLVLRTVRNGKATGRAVLFASPRSKLTSLALLKASKTSLKAAWVETSSAAGYVVPRAMMVQAGINPVQLFKVQDFLGSHEAVCQAVSEGKYDLGATFSYADATGPQVTGCLVALGKKAEALKVVAMSSEMPNDVLVAAPNFAQEKIAALITAARAAQTSPEGQKTLQSALLAEGVADVTDADFAPIRKALESFVP